MTTLLIAVAVAGTTWAAEPTGEQEAASLLRNGRVPVDGVLTGGQPTPEQFGAIREAGYETILNIRTEGETGNTSREAVEAMGFTYLELPIGGAPALNEANVRAFADLLEEARGPVVVHCGSGNRVGALFALKAFWIDGQSAEESLALGSAAGMTRLEPVVREHLGLGDE